MTKKKDILAALNSSMSFDEYLELIKELHAEQKATSFQDNEEFYNYSVLSLKRMERIYKKIEIDEELINEVKNISQFQNWMVISESWCGDASQTLPILAKLSTYNSNIRFCIVLRDSNEELMNHFLTNGGKSIPIIAILDESHEEIKRWGPRPKEAQNLVKEYKASPEPKIPYSEFNTQMQKWYNKDKGKSTITEILSILSD